MISLVAWLLSKIIRIMVPVGAYNMHAMTQIGNQAKRSAKFD